MSESISYALYISLCRNYEIVLENKYIFLLLVHFFSYGLMLYINQKQSKLIKQRSDRTLFVAQVSFITLLISLIVITAHSIIYAPLLKGQSSTDILKQLLQFNLPTLGLILLVGAMFNILSIARLSSQAKLPSYIFFPIYRSSIIAAVLFGYFIGGEEISPLKIIVCIIIFSSVSFFWFDTDKNKRNYTNLRTGIVIAILCAVLASATQLVSKILLSENFLSTPSIQQVDAISLVIGSNTINLLVCIILISRSKTFSVLHILQVSRYSSYSGIMNFIAFLTLNLFLVKGEMSIIYPVSALSIILPSIIMQLKGEESRPTIRQILVYISSLISIILLLLI